MGHADFARPRDGAAADKPRIRNGVMRRPKRPCRREASLRRKQARDGMDACGFETLFEAHWRKNGGDAFGKHCFPGPRRTDEQHVVTACHRDFDCAFRMELTADIPEVFAAPRRFLNLETSFGSHRINRSRSV